MSAIKSKMAATRSNTTGNDMASLAPGVNLWVKSEPFTFGALPVPPHPRLSVHNIKKIVSYAKNKGKSGYPRLSYTVWKHIAVNKLQLPIDLAWMYFTTFDLVGGESTPAQQIDWDEKFAKCSNQQEADVLRCQMSVPTLKFVLFLYIQQLHKISLRASLVSGSDEWPTRAKSPDLDGGRATPTTGKSIGQRDSVYFDFQFTSPFYEGLDEHGHMTFVLNNLTEIMEFLLDQDSYSGGTDFSDMSLSMDAVEALGFLIAGSTDKTRTVKPLGEIALMQQIHQKSGYSKVNLETSRSSRGIKVVISRSFSFRNLQSWLRSNISQNPFGISSCISTGRRLSWPLAGEDKESHIETKRGRIATNAHIVPKECIKGNKLIIMSQVGKQTVARNSGTLEGSAVKVHRCHYSYLYLLSPLRSVSIEKCRNSTIVLGAVSTTVHVNHCENCTVIATCRRITISGCTSCTFHTITPLRPLVFSGNEGLVFGPYHTFYPQLEEHMQASGLAPQLNMWDQPLHVGPDLGDHHQQMWELIGTKDFYPFTIPFEGDGQTKSVPGGIPSKYQKALNQREKHIEHWQKIMKEAGLSRDQRKQLQSVVESRFQEWLVETEHKRELDGLAVHPESKDS